VVSAETTMYKLCALPLPAFDRLSTVAASGYPAWQRPQATGMRVPKGPPAIPCRWVTQLRAKLRVGPVPAWCND
jgi:hypothetical protein